MIDSWRRHWFAEAPPHVFAAFRIAVGVAGCLTMLGMLDVRLLLSTDGIMPPIDRGFLGIRAAIARADLGLLAGWTVWSANFFVYAALTVGWRTNVMSLLAFVVSWGLIWWNPLPLSAAQHLIHSLTLYLVLSDTGLVWSMDAWLAARRGRPLAATPRPVWPLRLLQYQVCVMYVGAALYKLLDPAWRDGTALHYVLNYNTFQRIPGQVPPSFDPVLAVLGFTTLAWEGLFPLAFLTRTLKRVFVLIGVGMHVGMWALLDLGAFTPTVLAAYVAFIDAEDARALAAVWARIRKRAPRRSDGTEIARVEERPPSVLP
jgi:Vitamin K-dependent gamma-carboxylase